MGLKSSELVIFVDGASSGNPGPGGWGAILGEPQGEVVELGGPGGETTNNRMELTGSIEALHYSRNFQGKTFMFSDSQYVVLGITQWIFGWVRRNWRASNGKPVANLDLWKALLDETQNRKTEWFHLPAHRGIPGNERADQIAVSYTRGIKPKLFRGDIKSYNIDIFSQLPKHLGLTF